jgi:hypothetical protein
VDVVAVAEAPPVEQCVKRIGVSYHDLYFDSRDAVGRVELLHSMERAARDANWPGDFVAEWHAHDVELLGDCWHRITVVTATEELGWPRRFTRVRCALELTAGAKIMLALVGAWAALSLMQPSRWSLGIAAGLVAAVIGWMLTSRRRCFRSVCNLIYNAAIAANLEPVRNRAREVQSPPEVSIVHEDPQSCLQ